MITLSELLMGRDKEAPNEYTKEVQQNLTVLLSKMNSIREAYGAPMIINSGWRTQAVNNATKNAASKSKHLSGLACDVRDTDCKLWNWCMNNLKLMQDLGLYLEDKRWTSTWVHFQIGPSLSGKRIFRPSMAPPLNASLWNGTYDNSFDKI